MTDRLRIAVLFPLLTVAQGDEGNARVLLHRARLRGVEVELITHHQGPVPAADLYLLGGLDETTMPEFAERLSAGELTAAVEDGAAVLAVGVAFHVLGQTFVTGDGQQLPGVGLLDVATVRGPRVITGPVITRPNPALGLAALSGYECHVGITTLGTSAVPLAELELGVGNGGVGGGGDGTEPHADGAVQGRVIGSYIHGPLLARNADLADLLLGWALGKPLEPAPAVLADQLREIRIAEDRADPTGWGGRKYGQPTPSLRGLLRR